MVTTKSSKAYGLDRAAYNQGYDALYDFSVEDELSPPLIARGPGAVCTRITDDCWSDMRERLQGDKESGH